MGATRSSGQDPLIGATIADRYRIVSLIARGGMGKVYRAEQSALGRICALKLLVPDERREQDPEFFRRFSREAATAARLTHPNSVTVFDYGRDEPRGIYFIAMEYIAGRTLHRVLHDEGALPEARASRVARQICRALAEAHCLGLVHRDLKPSNVLLVDQGDEKDFVKVLDFGLVKDVSGQQQDDLTQKGLFIGSPKYTAPEQAMGHELSSRADIYALGVLLYEMLCGKVPFDKKVPTATLMAHVSEPPPPLAGRAQAAAVSPAMEALVMRCLEKSPDRRFQSMKECLTALKSAAGEPIDLTRASVPDRLPASQPGGALPSAPSISAPRIPAPSPSPNEPGAPPRAAPSEPAAPPRSLQSDSLSPPQAPPTFSGSVGPPRQPPVSVYFVALVAALVGGGIVLALTGHVRGRGPDAASAPAAVQPAPVPLAVPAEAPGREPGAAAEFRIVRIESAPPGARVSDRGTEVCLATPCRLVLQGAGTTAEYQLTLTKPGYRSTVLAVRPEDEAASAELEALAAAPAASAPSPQATASAPPEPAPPAEPSSAEPPSTEPPSAAEPSVALPTAAALPEPPATAPGAVPAAPAPAAPEILRFQEGMTRPAPITAPAVVYTRQARQARVEGTVLAKCVVTTAGSLTGCRIVKGVPHMNEAVLEALAASRYKPVTYQGRPVNVDYVFSIKLVLP